MNGLRDRNLERQLTLREAGRLIYHSEQLTAVQFRNLRKHLEDGTLQGQRSTQGHWTTTTGSVAQFMAGQAYLHLLGEEDANSPGRSAASREVTLSKSLRKQSASLRQVYEEAFKDYFLAIIFRRQSHRRSTAFGLAVVVGQVGLLLAILWSVVAGLRSASNGLIGDNSTERTAVLQWLAEHEHEYQVTRWHPAQQDTDGKNYSIRVQYTYPAASRKIVSTDRVFTLRDGKVVGCSSSP